MNIEIIGTETLGVRGLSCFVKVNDMKILIDPGIALGYNRHGYLPHPLQVAVGERTRERIINRWREATDIVISHFDGDHVPLEDANPYQLDIYRLIEINSKARIWIKKKTNLTNLEKRRFEALARILNTNIIIEGEGKSYGSIRFSWAVPHGREGSIKKVMMTRIEDNDHIFVHASDIQLLNREAVKKILSWEPDIVFADGPPIYRKLPDRQLKIAWRNALILAENIETLILDHHLMRCMEGIRWIEKLSLNTGNRVLCAADFMKRPRIMLEALREKLYRDMPVPIYWHRKYAEKKTTTEYYWKLGRHYMKNITQSLSKEH